jgi:hypothetical protein
VQIFAAIEAALQTPARVFEQRDIYGAGDAAQKIAGRLATL